MKYYTHNEVLDEVVGSKDSTARMEYDAKMQAYLVGEAIKAARIAQNLTQEEFGRMMGIQAARVSKIEHGQNLTLDTSIRAFKAWDSSVELECAGTAKVPRC